MIRNIFVSSRVCFPVCVCVCVSQMREGARPGAHLSDQDQTTDLGLSSRLHSNYELQVAVHMTLTQLRSFCYDMIRSLREFATYRRSLATAR